MATTASNRNWFAIWTSAIVVVVIVAVIVAVTLINNQATGPGTKPEAAIVNTDTGAISVGKGSNTLDTYIDFMCPNCNEFETVYGSTIDKALADGKVTLNIHPIAILDNSSQGTKYSTRAANAMYCVAVKDGDKALDFMRAMFKNQPKELSTGLTDAQIVAIAKDTGVTGIDSCVTSGEYSKFVTNLTPKTPVREGAAGIGTPTVVLNGKILALTGNPTADLTANLK